MDAAPDPNTLHPVTGHDRVGFLKPLVRLPHVEVGDFPYYDHPEAALAFERDAVLYAYGPQRLVIGRFCAMAAGVRFLLPGADHAHRGPSKHTREIMAGRPAELLRIAHRHGPHRS